MPNLNMNHQMVAESFWSELSASANFSHRRQNVVGELMLLFSVQVDWGTSE